MSPNWQLIKTLENKATGANIHQVKGFIGHYRGLVKSYNYSPRLRQRKLQLIREYEKELSSLTSNST